VKSHRLFEPRSAVQRRPWSRLLGSWLALTTLGLAASTAAVAAVPSQVGVEGVLLSSGSGPAADGNYTMGFAIYAAETGGSALWSEAGVNVQVKGGQFYYTLGAKSPLTAAVANQTSAWLGLQIGTDPELPRRPLGAAPFALRAAMADGLDCTGCIKAGHMDAAVLQPYAKASDLSGYAKLSDLTGYVKASDLSSYAKTSDLADYVKAASLAKVAGTGSYADLINKPTLAAVASSGSYADLSNKPVQAKLGDACGTNLVLKGLKADGSYECVTAGIAPDMINEISNDLLWNQFSESTAGTPDVAIKDGFVAGTKDSLTFPDLGIVQKIWVDVSLVNSDVSKLEIELYGPGQATPYILYKGGSTGTALAAKFNNGTNLISGDLSKDWVGKNAKGSWSINVKDAATIAVPPGTPAFEFDGKFNWSVAVETLSSKKIQVKGDLILGGGLQLNVADSHPVTCDAGRFGYMYANRKDNAMYVCNGKAFFPLLLTLPPGNKDNPATNCKQVLTFNPASKTGTYWLDPDGAGGNPAFEAYCEMTYAGGGWTLVFNMDTNDAATRGYGDTDFWLKADKLYGLPSTALQSDYKGQTFSTVPGSEVLVWAHKEGAEWSSPAAYARMSVVNGLQNKTMADWLAQPANTALSTGKVDVSGSVSKPGTYARTAGDVFIDNGLPLIVNSTGKGGTDAVNTVRLGTDFGPICAIVDCNGHNVQGGYGGYHIRPSSGGYPLTYEAEPSFGYHPGPMGFGDNYVNNNGCGNSVWNNQCAPVTTTLQVDFAVFVR
jgi:hypothetical protein